MGMHEKYYGDSDEFFGNLHEEFDCDGEPVALPQPTLREKILDILQEPAIWYAAGLIDAALIILAVRYLVNS